MFSATDRTGPTHEARFAELDAFRGIAALWVVIFHYGLHFPALYGSASDPGWWRDLVALAAAPTNHLGDLPVFWFFTISGFVIVWTLDRCRVPGDFVVSRLSRLLPTFWMAVLLSSAVAILAPLPNQDVSMSALLANLTMVPQALGAPLLDGAYWSLLPELVFYVWAGLIFASGRLWRVHEICGAWVLGCIADTLLTEAGISVPFRVERYALLTFGHFFAAGVMFFQLWRGRRAVVAWVVLGLCIVSVCLAYAPMDAAVCLIFFAAFLAATQGRLRWLARTWLVALGSISYALYVSHQMLGYRLMWFLEQRGVPHVTAVLLAIGAALALAAGITHVVERPAMRAIRTAWRAREAMT